MRPYALAVVFLVAACQKDASDSPSVDPTYKQDVERICDVERLAGVADHPDEDPRIVTAMWLGDNLKSQQARSFLVELQPLGPADKAKRLRDEARRVGLTSCVLAATWEAEV